MPGLPKNKTLTGVGEVKTGKQEERVFIQVFCTVAYEHIAFKGHISVKTAQRDGQKPH